MALTIKIAQTPAEKEAVYSLRHQVFAEEEEYYRIQPNRRIKDRFDELDTTANLMAYIDGNLVGSVRVTQNSIHGMPSEGDFDYPPHLPYYDDRVLSGSMLCVKKAFRKTKQIAQRLLFMAIYWGYHRKITHYIAPINPVARSFFHRLGYHVAGEVFKEREKGLPTLPTILDINNASEEVKEFINLQEKVAAIETFQRVFLNENSIFSCNHVCLIMRGRVEPTKEEGIGALGGGNWLSPAHFPVKTLEPVELFFIQTPKVKQLQAETSALTKLEIMIPTDSGWSPSLNSEEVIEAKAVQSS